MISEGTIRMFTIFIPSLTLRTIIFNNIKYLHNVNTKLGFWASAKKRSYRTQNTEIFPRSTTTNLNNINLY